MKFAELATYFSRIENTASRNEMTELLAGLFVDASAEEINKVVYMLQGRVAPQYVKSDFGLGEKMVIKAAIKALQVDEKLFRAEQKETGDTGISVEKLRSGVMTIGQQDLSVSEVFERLHQITVTSGEGSQDKKLAILADLIQALDPLSTRYVVRIPTQTLRLGFSDMTVLDALSWFVSGDKSHRKAIEEAYHVRPDLGFVAHTVKTQGIVGLKNVEPQVFTPILMMKAQRLPTPQDIFDKLMTGLIEPKYDGFRLQVHYDKKRGVKLFSRGLEDVTHMYPDVVEGIERDLRAESAILEGEAIGFDPYTGNFLPFQETVQRKRLYGIEEKAKEIPLKMFVFELLYLDGKSYLHTPLTERMATLRKHVKDQKDIHTATLLLSPENHMDSADIVQNAFEESVAKGLEGIMVKKKDGLYQPGARGWNWIKYKRSYSAKLSDTIDCLVMGFDKGKGKRANFGIGAFLVGVYDAKDDLFKTVAKIGTGLSDEQWRTLYAECTKLQVDHKPALYDVDKLVYVDVWVNPRIVVEIKADEISRSQMHTAGRTMQASKSGKAEEVKTPGYALRFPRLTRFRDDKQPEDITTVVEVAAMHDAQIATQKGK